MFVFVLVETKIVTCLNPAVSFMMSDVCPCAMTRVVVHALAQTLFSLSFFWAVTTSDQDFSRKYISERKLLFQNMFTGEDFSTKVTCKFTPLSAYLGSKKSGQ